MADPTVHHQFLAILSHELRTPLTPALARLGLLEREPGLSPEVRQHLSGIRRSIEREAQLIDQLLDLGRIVRGELELDRRLTDVHDLLRALAGARAQEIVARKLTVSLDLRADPCCILADEQRLGQALGGLIDNAIKFTPEGGRIALTTENSSPGRLLVHVEDFGAGIDPAVMPRLFEPFEQGEQMLARRYSGLGVGLCLAKSLVELHGGAIAALSEGPGHGTVITVELPSHGAAAEP